MWSPLRAPIFRAVWIGWVVSNTGTWMQNAGAAWLMASLTPSPLLVALMQTATSLPVFLVGVPAGTLADVVDRRKLLLVTQTWMLLAALALGLLAWAGLASEWVLLTFTFMIGLGVALTSPAWNAVIPELVERKELPAAIALNSAGYHVAQAIGPALGGLVVAAAGAAAAFLINAASFLGVLGAIFSWKRSKSAEAANDAPPEDMLGATAAGIRYVRHSRAMKAVLVRNGLFMLGASALWSLLPSMSKHELGLEATGYGIVLGSLGLGAVGGALVLPRLRRLLSVDALTVWATVVFAAASLGVAYLRFVPLVLVSTMVGGLAWLIMLSTLGYASQTACPAWVRARALAIYLLVFQGTLAAGSLTWGAVAERFGSGTALALAALVLVVGLAAAVRWPLRVVEGLDLSPSGHWPDPEVALAPKAEDGPVLISIDYRVPAERSRDFIEVMDAMHTFRRREGAVSWGIFRDVAEPEHYVETFLVVTWGEHMRQHARVTMEDQVLEARRNEFLDPKVAPFTTHLVDAHAFEGRVSAGDVGAEVPPI